MIIENQLMNCQGVRGIVTSIVGSSHCAPTEVLEVQEVLEVHREVQQEVQEVHRKSRCCYACSC
jgi:hypothetical protein